MSEIRYNDRGEVVFESSETLRSVMLQVYIWMTMGLLVTAASAFATVETGLVDTLIQTPMIVFGAFIVELGLVVWLSAGINKMAAGMAITVFFIYAAINGFTLSLILLAYTAGSVTAAFVSTASLFGAMSIYGATTKADLSKFRNLLFMGLIGLIIAMIVNMFIGSNAMDMLISVAGVLIFTGLVAYDTQHINRLASNPALTGNNEAVTKVGIIGALKLYLDFINLFIFLLRLMGRRR